jgi:hypothetical protein
VGVRVPPSAPETRGPGAIRAFFVVSSTRASATGLRRWFAETPPDEITSQYRTLAGKIAAGTLAVDVEQIYPLTRLKEAVAHAARG